MWNFWLSRAMGVSIVTVLGLVLLLAGDHASAWVEQPPPEVRPSDSTAPASTIQRRGACDLSSSTITPANTFFLLSDVRACIESAAIDTAAATQTKQALTDLLTMYSFVVSPIRYYHSSLVVGRIAYSCLILCYHSSLVCRPLPHRSQRRCLRTSQRITQPSPGSQCK